MDTKRLAIGTIVGAIVLYLLGYLIWDILFADFFAENAGTAVGVEREAPLQWALILGMLLYGLLLALALEAFEVGSNAIKGLIVGAVTGLLVWGTADITLYSLNNVSTLTGAIADTILEGVHGGVTGLIVVIALGFVGGAKAPQG